MTSLGAMPVEIDKTGIDIAYSCSQKGIELSSGTVAHHRLAARHGVAEVAQDAVIIPGTSTSSSSPTTWSNRIAIITPRRRPCSTRCAKGLALIEEEGLENRWERHHQAHLEFVKKIEALGLEMLVPPANRIWNLNTPKVPQASTMRKFAPRCSGERHRDRRRLRAARRKGVPRWPDGSAGDQRKRQ